MALICEKITKLSLEICKIKILSLSLRHKN